MTEVLKGRFWGRYVPLARPALLLGRKIRDRIEIWRATRRLFAADDAMLKDIGISRGDIERLIRHGRKPRRPE
jgi:uncharacterized protein YjiS (DUF1127 family)